MNTSRAIGQLVLSARKISGHNLLENTDTCVLVRLGGAFGTVDPSSQQRFLFAEAVVQTISGNGRKVLLIGPMEQVVLVHLIR